MWRCPKINSPIPAIPRSYVKVVLSEVLDDGKLVLETIEGCARQRVSINCLLDSAKYANLLLRSSLQEFVAKAIACEVFCSRWGI